MKCLGLDISTTSTGWAILEQNSSPNLSLVDYGRIDFSKETSHKERLIIFQELIFQLMRSPNNIFDYVIIEDTFVRFDPLVTKKLSRFAGVAIAAIVSAQPNATIALIPPQAIKAAIFPKQKKDKDDIKLEMLVRYKLVDVSNSNEVKKFCNDITDAIAIAHFPFLKKVNEKWIV